MTGVRLEIADANDYVIQAKNYVAWSYGQCFLYDVIILDITDPSENGIETGLLTKEFLSHCRDLLNPNGVVIVQSGCPINNKIHYNKLSILMSSLFDDIAATTQFVECYGEHQSFIAGYVK